MFVRMSGFCTLCNHLAVNNLGYCRFHSDKKAAELCAKKQGFSTDSAEIMIMCTLCDAVRVAGSQYCEKHINGTEWQSANSKIQSKASHHVGEIVNTYVRGEPSEDDIKSKGSRQATCDRDWQDWRSADEQKTDCAYLMCDQGCCNGENLCDRHIKKRLISQENGDIPKIEEFANTDEQRAILESIRSCSNALKLSCSITPPSFPTFSSTSSSTSCSSTSCSSTSSSSSSSSSSQNDHLKILEWVRSIGCDWNTSTSLQNTSGGRRIAKYFEFAQCSCLPWTRCNQSIVKYERYPRPLTAEQCKEPFVLACMDLQQFDKGDPDVALVTQRLHWCAEAASPAIYAPYANLSYDDRPDTVRLHRSEYNGSNLLIWNSEVEAYALSRDLNRCYFVLFPKK